MEVSRLDLIKLALVSSDNVAAITLAENYIGGEHGFVESMNSNAKKLNMNNTGFVEPTGLSVMNYSTTGDVITLTNALAQYKIFKDAGQTKELSILIRKNKKMMILHSRPTSTYFGDDRVLALKTGFTNAAGFCITMLVSVNNQNYNIVILGSRTPAERSKIIKQTLARLQ
jgi:D-alanyl-D-alanine endopeptidase (penicillin-binding protein 7)